MANTKSIVLRCQNEDIADELFQQLEGFLVESGQLEGWDIDFNYDVNKIGQKIIKITNKAYENIGDG